jgi:hypothetical protein
MPPLLLLLLDTPPLELLLLVLPPLELLLLVPPPELLLVPSASSPGMLTTFPLELAPHAGPIAATATVSPETNTLGNATRRLMVLFLPEYGAAAQRRATLTRPPSS